MCDSIHTNTIKEMIETILKLLFNDSPNPPAMLGRMEKDGFHPLLKEYGQVILDECQHGASDSAIEVLQEVSAKHVYGVTATPKRRVTKLIS